MNPEFREFLARGERAGMRYRLAVPRDPVSGYAGFDIGRRAGSSLDFKDYREYQPGDDLRHIDWHVYARTDKLTVKLFREEVSPHADIVLDVSASTGLDGTAKAEASLGLAAALAVAAGNAKCSHHAWLAGDTIRKLPNGGEAPSRWDGVDLGQASALEQAFAAAPAWRRGGIRILVSDLLWPGDPLAVLRRFSHGASAVAVVQVLAQGDVDPPDPGNIRLADVETGETLELYLDAAGRDRYAKALAQHRQTWERACRQANALLATVVAEQVVAGWALHALEEVRLLEAG